MRENKYRGRRLDNGEWVYGSLVINNNLAYIYNGHSCPSEVNFEYDFIPVDPTTVGQYTGLKDKNGREIYEGDIVNDDETINGSVYSQEYVIEHSEIHCGFVGVAAQRLLTPSCFDDVKVIGNIHDNPELLKTK